MTSSGQTKVVRGPFRGALATLFGQRFWGLERNEGGLTLLARRARTIDFLDMLGPLRTARHFGLTSISVPLADGAVVRVTGLNRAGLVSFVDTTNLAWRRTVSAAFAAALPELDALAHVVERLLVPRRFPAACALQPFLQRANTFAARLPKADPTAFLSIVQLQQLNLVLDFYKQPEQLRAAAIDAFVDAELGDMAGFFDSIESHPLTPEQRRAVVTDEDATLVLAGAGSGKTSVIVAKAAYLIERGIRRPEDILLLAFGKDAAAEMATRIAERCGAPITASTFHALGYTILKEVEGQGPALAPHASDDAQFHALLREILITDVASKPDLIHLIVRWFSEFFWPYKGEWDFKSMDEYFQYVEAHEIRTLQGERVRSFEECEIANWLYLNGIAYDYEPLYEHPLPENNRRAYTPDFRLRDSGVYLEHFGVRRERASNGTVRLTTASYVDREAYLDGMAWKRKVHRDHGTTLIETYSYERVEGCLTEALRDKLAPYVTLKPIPSETIFETLSRLGQVDAFTQMLGTFLRHFKSARLTVDRCRERAETAADRPRQRAFLAIFEPVFAAYQRRLGARIDFEDMIARATDHVSAGRFSSPYRHLLVDEFQDLSAGRAALLLALKAQHPDARIFAVGDDWQSIYRFTGADLHFMRNFGALFGGTFAASKGVHSTVDLGRTFRSVDKIALPARRFVLKNPAQISKQMIPAGTANGPAIRIASATTIDEGAVLNTLLRDIARSTARKTSVLLLGRYRFVCPENLADLARDHPGLSLRFMTVHASKGLEADHVIILRARSGRLGFPSEIVDDPLLDLVLPEPESFDHAEERRLFYVALTRARTSVTILTDRHKPSAFVRELLTDHRDEVVDSGAVGMAAHRCRVCDGRLQADASASGRIIFACEHRFLCGAVVPSCAGCNADIPTQTGANSGLLTCTCGAEFRACPDCREGWLVARRGPYGEFLGCIHYPACKGKGQLSRKANHRTAGQARRRR
jgi:DNA helicase-4